MEKLKTKGIKAFIWDFVGKIIRQASGFIITIFLARLLVPDDFGLIAVVMAIVAIATIFTDAGLGVALIQGRHLRDIHYTSVFYYNILLGLFFMFIMYTLAPSIARYYEYEVLTDLVQAISFFFIINTLGAIQSVRLRKALNFKVLALVSFTSSIVSGITGVVLAVYGAGVWSLVVQVLLAQILYTILVWIKSEWYPSLSFSLKALKQLWGFGFKIFLSKVLDTCFSRLDVILFTKLFPVATIGLYHRAKSLNSLVLRYSSESLMAVLFPLLSTIQNDLKRFQDIVLKALNVLSFITFFIIGALYLVSEELIVLLYTEKWLPSAEYLKLLLLGSFSFPIGALLVNILSSRGNSKDFLYLEVYKKVLLSINLIVGYFWGLSFFLYGLVLGSFIATYINIVFASKEISINKIKFIFPILVHMAISVFSISVVIHANKFIVYSDILMLFIKFSEYFLLYTLISRMIHTSGYQIFVHEIILFMNKIFTKRD